MLTPEHHARVPANSGQFVSHQGGEPVMAWSTYVALGDSLTAGRGDAGSDGRPVGWAQRLAGLLTARTGVRCSLTNLAADGATLTDVLTRQLPLAAGTCPDLVSVTVGVNDIRARGFGKQ